MNDKERFVRERMSKRTDEDPQLLIQECCCGAPNCFAFVIGLLRPRLVEVDDQTVFIAHVPVMHGAAHRQSDSGVSGGQGRGGNVKTPQFKIEFVPSGRGKAQCAPDPRFPEGVHVDLKITGTPSCTAELPYQAPECGHFLVECRQCPFTLIVTAAGRADDPRSITMPCLPATC